MIGFAFARNGDDDDFSSDVYAGTVGLGFGVDFVGAGFVFPAFVFAEGRLVDGHFIVVLFGYARGRSA